MVLHSGAHTCSIVLIVLKFVKSYGQSTRGIEVGFPEKWDAESYKETECPTRGIPTFLDGYFLCQVSGAYGRDFDPPGQRLTNMIDAMGAVASFHINRGKKVTLNAAYYPSRPYKIWEFYDKDMRKSKVAWSVGFDFYNKTAADLWAQIPEDPDVLPFHPNVDFWEIGRDIIGGTESADWVGARFDVPTLDNFHKFPFIETNDIFRGTSPIKLMQMPIHERVESNGDIWASTSAFNPQDRRMYQIVFTVSPSGVRRMEGIFEFGSYNPTKCTPTGEYRGNKKVFASYMHSITSTENYVILPLTSTLLNPCKFSIEQQVSKSGIVAPRSDDFERDMPLRFLIFNKRSKRFETQKPLEAVPAMWISHQFNAYEKPDETIVADMIAYDRGDIYQKELNVDTRKRQVFPATSRLLRFTIDLKKQRIKYNYLTPQEQLSAEFPQFNHDFEGKNYKYGYVVIFPYAAGSGILKIDMDDPSGRENKLFQPGPSIVVSEPWYVPKPGSRTEHDGVLLVRGLDTSTKRTTMYVLSAETMKEIGRATAPCAVPFGFHNRFYAKADLGLSPGYNPYSTARNPIKPNSGSLQPLPVNPSFLQPQPVSPMFPSPNQMPGSTQLHPNLKSKGVIDTPLNPPRTSPFNPFLPSNNGRRINFRRIAEASRRTVCSIGFFKDMLQQTNLCGFN